MIKKGPDPHFPDPSLCALKPLSLYKGVVSLLMSDGGLFSVTGVDIRFIRRISKIIKSQCQHLKAVHQIAGRSAQHFIYKEIVRLQPL